MITSIVALSGIFSVHRVTADSAGTSATQADGSPTQIATLARYLDAGESHMCVVITDGQLKCFGSNSSGQIGSGGTASLGDSTAEMGDALIAVNVGTGRTVRAAHVCQLLAKRVPGVQITTTVAISGEVQVSDRTSTQAAIPLRLAARDLSRRVLVVARPGRL